MGERDRLGRAHPRATPPPCQTAYLGQDQKALVERGPSAKRLIGEGVGAVFALEARNPRCLTRLHPTKERLRAPIQPGEHVLHHLGMHLLGVREGDFELRQLRFLLSMGSGWALAASPPGAPLLPRTGVEPVAQPQRLLQRPLLLSSGSELVLECLAHGGLGQRCLFWLLGALAARWWAIHPPLTRHGPSGPFSVTTASSAYAC